MDAGLRVQLEGSEEVPVIRVAGEVDLTTAPELRAKLAELPAAGGTVVIDMSEVTFLDSTGLSVLVASWKRLCEAGEKNSFRLVVNRPAIQRVLDVTGLTQIFEVFSSLEEATKP
jgi:anti-sigma B factor antagonist